MTLDLIETGNAKGPTLVFVPGSYSTPSAWRPVQAALSEEYRMLAISLPGYGQTAEVRDAANPRIDALARWLADVLADRAGRRAHVVAHSFGGFVALDALVRGVEMASLITFEANPISWQVDDTAPWKAEAQALTDRFAAAIDAGDQDAAGLIIDFYGGPGTFAAMPGSVRDFCRQTVQTNLLDWRCAVGSGWPVSAVANVEVAITLVRGAFANEPVSGINKALAAANPRAQVAVVENAGHFLITTHPAACAALIEAHIARAEEGART